MTLIEEASDIFLDSEVEVYIFVTCSSHALQPRRASNSAGFVSLEEMFQYRCLLNGQCTLVLKQLICGSSVVTVQCPHKCGVSETF